jgi:pimeloyl-ACP methyl ester carboxylesterase
MEPEIRNSREVVIVLHGFGASPKWMLLLCRRIARTGRRVLNWGYSSWRGSIDASATRLIDTVEALGTDPTVERIHFVCYSMGSIICRSALLRVRNTDKLGRVVMLGPPNRGSHVASFFAPWVGRFVPAVRELSTDPASFVNGLPRLHGVHVGVIAGQRDRIVHHDNTHLSCQREHVTVSGGHASLLLSRDVARMALHFVERGTFALDVALEPAVPALMPTLGLSTLSPAQSG